VKLCAAHEEAVLAAFAGWTRVPEAYRTPDKLGWYGPGLIGVAQHFAQVRGRPELLQSMVGPPQSNPLVGWQRALAEVSALMKEHRYAEAVPRLRTTLEQTADLQGTGADAYRPVTHGHLGQCLFQLGDTEAARAPTEQALRLCEAAGDHFHRRIQGPEAVGVGCLVQEALELDFSAHIDLHCSRHRGGLHWRAPGAPAGSGAPGYRGPTCYAASLPRSTPASRAGCSLRGYR